MDILLLASAMMGSCAVLIMHYLFNKDRTDTNECRLEYKTSVSEAALALHIKLLEFEEEGVKIESCGIRQHVGSLLWRPYIRVESVLVTVEELHGGKFSTA